MQKRHILLLLFLLEVHFLVAQKYSNEFLSIGVGARAQALGTAVIASVDDVTAGVWNPAGLAARESFKGLEIGAMHTEWFAGVGKFDYAGIILPFASQRRRMAISFIRFGIDNIPNTLSLYESDGTVNFDNLREFSAADYAFFLSYGQDLAIQKGQLLIGANIKVVHRRIGPFATSWGFGLDAGLQYRIKDWKFGLLARDIPSTFNAWSFSFTDEEKETLEFTNNEIPINSVETTKPQILLGMARRFPINKMGIAPEFNLIFTTDGKRNTLLSADPISMDPALGLELDYNQFVFVRAGVNQFQEQTDFDGSSNLTARPSLGVGFKISSLKVDYGFTDLGAENNTYSHVISLVLHLQPKE